MTRDVLAPWRHDIARRKAYPTRSLLSLQSKSCLMIILVFMKEEDNYFTREAEIIIDIVHVYDLDKDWF